MMIRDMDILFTDAGQIVLTVPGRVPSGLLILELHPERVTLSADGACFVEVCDVANPVLDALAGVGDRIELIAIPDPVHPPATPTHEAVLVDRRSVIPS